MTSTAMPRHGASTIVCCYNSESRIVATIEHLAAQRVRVPWEVVLVNNNCSDGTVAVAERTWRRMGGPTTLRIVNEFKPGLSFARKTGAKQAKYEYLVFCDDDNWLDAAYLQTSVDVLSSRPDIGVVGGQGAAVANVAWPDWFSQFEAGFAVGIPAPQSGDVSARGYVWGAGMALRRSVYLCMLAAGAKHLLTDRTKAQLCSGGDTEICLWHMFSGFKLWYDQELKFKHFVPESRLTMQYVERLYDGFREQDVILQQYWKQFAVLASTRPRIKSIRSLLAWLRDPARAVRRNLIAGRKAKRRFDARVAAIAKTPGQTQAAAAASASMDATNRTNSDQIQRAAA